MRKISSTELKQKTKEILDYVEDSNIATAIYTYGKPKAVLVSYDEWQKYSTPQADEGNPTLDQLQKFMFKSGKKTNLTKLIRHQRDEE